MKNHIEPDDQIEGNDRFLVDLDDELFAAIPVLKKKFHCRSRNQVINLAVRIAMDSVEQIPIQKSVSEIDETVTELRVRMNFTTELLSDLYCNWMIVNGVELARLSESGDNIDRRRASAETLLGIAENGAARRTASGSDRFLIALELTGVNTSPENRALPSDPK